MQRDHWDELFDEIYLRTYALRLGERESAVEAAAAAELAGVEPPAEILDAPGGFGRHSIPLAQAGYRVTSVDRSAVQQDEGKRQPGAEGVTWVHADVRELPFADASFDAVLCLFTSIGYRGEDEDRRAFAEFTRVLRPGSALIVETLPRDRLMAIFQERSWERLEGDSMLVEGRRFDHVAGEVETEHILIANGHQRSVTFRVRVYTPTELVRLLDAIGYEDVECFGDLEGGELSRETRLVVRARKPTA